MTTLRTFFAIALALIIAIPGIAQTEHQKAASSIDYYKLGTYVPGMLIYKDGTIEEWSGIEYQNPERIKKLDNMLYYNKPGQMARASVSQTDLEAFEIGNNKWGRITHDGEEQFGILHTEGAITVYSIFKIPVIRETGDYIEERFIKKLDQEPISFVKFMFKYKKLIVALVEDNQELVSKIKSKEKGYKGLLNSEKVMAEYNLWHKTQYPEMYN